MRLQIVQDVIDIIRGKNRHKLNQLFLIQKNCLATIRSLRKKVENGQKIKVAFLQQYLASNHNYDVFEKMLESDIFDPYFIVNPDVYRSKEHMFKTYNSCFYGLVKRYGRSKVLHGWIIQSNCYIDYTDDFDIAFASTPYEEMSHSLFKISYWVINKRIPIFFIPYYYWGLSEVTIDNLKNNCSNLFYKIFVPNMFSKKLAIKYQLLKGKNLEVMGYPKMDKIANLKNTKNNYRKTIIIAPHHSIGNIYFQGGAFLEYAEILLEIPQKYPEIDFVFRPHPLLKENLEKDEYWGKEKTESFFSKLLSYKNVIYSLDDDYLQLFINSDALIHDCGSFMAEYFYIGKPCAFCFRKDLDISRIYTSFGQECLDNHYHIKSKHDFFTFIEEVVLNKSDLKKESRNKFLHGMIMVNYPNASSSIVNYIKSIIYNS